MYRGGALSGSTMVSGGAAPADGGTATKVAVVEANGGLVAVAMTTVGAVGAAEEGVVAGGVAELVSS